MRKTPSKKKSVPENGVSERVSFRFRAIVMRKLNALEEKKGVNRTSIAAQAIMELAEREGL